MWQASLVYPNSAFANSQATSKFCNLDRGAFLSHFESEEPGGL